MKHIIPKTLFSSSSFPKWGAWTVRTFNKPLSKNIFKISTLWLCFLTLTTLSTHFSAMNIPTLSDLSKPPIQNSYISFGFSSIELVTTTFPSCFLMHATSTFLSDNASTTSPALPVSKSTFQVPTRNPQPFHTGLCCVPAGFPHLLFV